MQSISEIIDFFRENFSDLNGCTLTEIEQLEQGYHIKLPSAYKAFLQLMGHDAKDYQVGSDYHYTWLLTSRSYANELLARNERPSLPDNTFVFWGHQGYQFSFFYTDILEDDPLVYYYNECYEIPEFLETFRLIQFLYDPAHAVSNALRGVKDNGKCC